MQPGFRLSKAMAEATKFEYTCPECSHVYYDEKEKFCTHEGDRGRDRCVYCNRMKKRVSDTLQKVTPDVAKAWRALKPQTKKIYMAERLHAPVSDLPALMRAFVEEAPIHT